MYVFVCVASAMSPFKGQGANQALVDAVSIARNLVSSEFAHPGRRPLAEALRSYEKEMCVRAAAKVLKSRTAAVYLHSPAALAQANVTRAMAAEIAFSYTPTGASPI
jgi:salicylate hydroxylase